MGNTGSSCNIKSLAVNNPPLPIRPICGVLCPQEPKTIYHPFYLLQDNLCSLSAEILPVHVAGVANGKWLGDVDPSKCFEV